MVTRRGRGDAGQRRRRSRGPSTEGRPRSSGSRRRGSGLSAKSTSEDEEQTHTESETHEEEGRKRARTVIRKSPRLQNPPGVRRSGPRRSTRTTRPTCSTTPSVLKTMDSVKNKRRLSNSKEGKIYSKAQRRRTPVPPPSDIDDSNGASEDSRAAAADEDSGSDGRNFNAKPSRASSLYQGPSSDFPGGTFRISASGPNTTRRGAFRPTKSAWSSQSDEDGSDDEEETAPGGSVSCRPLGHVGTRRDKMAAGAGLADIDPMAIDQSVGFDSIGGLSGHISALKEMVVFPLLYPEVFDNFKIQPPRGCLFYGPPGTGKTLVARALANECSHGNRKVSFFMRKGADCLSKWVGESERQLRLLFDQAYKMRPSIIFFDEIDGLAPVRSSRQDQIHSSIVSTLLALMDGLDSRGEVVVIGATNRLDSIDPALRRPGRFDREFLFGLPDRESRREILKIHTRQWKPAPSEDFLDELAEKCVGYCGADIRAVCTEAALCALRRRYPQIYGTSQKLLLDVSSIAVSSCDFVAAMGKMSPASHRSATSPAKPLSPVVHPLLGAALCDVLRALQRLFPHAEQGMKRKREPDLTSGVLDDGLTGGADEASSISEPAASRNRTFLHFARSAVKQPTSHRPRMLLAGRPGAGQSSHLAPAILHALERFTVHSLDSAVLFGVSSTSPEEACAQVFCEAKRTSPSILYVPHIQQWWDTAGPALRASFLSLLNSIPSFSPILLLATTSVPRRQLDPEIQGLFREEYGEVYVVGVPSRRQRTAFFQDLILNQAAEAPPPKNKTATQPLEVLPLAPPPPPRQLSEEERLRLEEQEEDVLRELRLFLRNITERLSLDRRFKAFTGPVDTEEVPDYLMVVRKPMDLSTLLTNIDEHNYVTVGEFVSDADLIWQNVLENDPDGAATDRHLRHRACALKDTIRAIIRDELDEEFERVCEEIRESRIHRAAFSSRTDVDPEDAAFSSLFSNSPGPRARKKKPHKRARKSKWSTGVIKKPKKKKKKPPSLPPVPASPSPSPSSSSFSSSCSVSSFSSSSSFLLFLPSSFKAGSVLSGEESGAPNGCSSLGSSSESESSDGELNGYHHHHPPPPPHRRRFNGDDKHGVLVNGYHGPEPRDLRPRPSETPRAPDSGPSGARLNKLEKRRHQETGHAPASARKQLVTGDSSVDVPDGETPPLVVDRSKLKDLLNRAVGKTDGAEVEPLEKLYALLAQCIYRHRDSYNKTELVQEMREEVDSFS